MGLGKEELFFLCGSPKRGVDWFKLDDECPEVIVRFCCLDLRIVSAACYKRECRNRHQLSYQ